MLLRFFFGAEPLGVIRLGRPGGKLNSIISHILIVSPNEAECR